MQKTITIGIVIAAALMSFSACGNPDSLAGTTMTKPRRYTYRTDAVLNAGFNTSYTPSFS